MIICMLENVDVSDAHENYDLGFGKFSLNMSF